jgi:hypothetical protein
VQYIYFGDADDNDVGYLAYSHSTNLFTLVCNTSAVITATDSAWNFGAGISVKLGAGTPASGLHIDDDAGGADLGYITLEELSASASAPAADRVAIYAKDNGAGKTVLYARFQSGAEQQLAIEP